MKYIFKYIGISVALIFSFCYTEKTNDILISNTKLFNIIKEQSDNYEKESIDAKINGIYIIPGINGEKVQLLDSYYNMKEHNIFDENNLKYTKVTPVISITNNKNKIINKGNKNKKCISIIIKDNKNIIDYSYSVGIDFSRIVDLTTFDKLYSYEQINNEVENFNILERRIKKKSSSDVCVLNNLNKELCQKNNKFLVKPTLTLNSHNFSEIKSNINNGYIIYIEDNVKLIDYKLLLKQIYYQDLKIVRVSKLINEERDC